MKAFNNDFTTPKQSMRLLELGLQPNSANLFYSKFGSETFGTKPKLCYNKRYCDIVPYGYEEYYIPCWSVGRLIEIMKICSDGVTTWYLHSEGVQPLIEQLIDFLERFENDLSFSKLNQ